MSNHYQLAVIGSGAGGREATLLAARKGLRTTLIERDKLGGTSFHSGCYAVCALQACARQFRDSWKSGRFGSKIDLLKATLYDWMIAQQKVSSRLADSFQAELQELNVDVHQGHGEFLDNRTIQVIGVRGSKKSVTADHVVVATGSRPEFYGSSIRGMVNSDELLRITTLPNHLAIIGAGHIGCEFASIYRTLGCEVTLIEKESRILPGWEHEAGERVARSLEDLGIAVQLNHHVSFAGIEVKGGRVCIPGSEGKAIEANLALVATGRTPNLEALNLKALGVEDSSFLKVDERMRLPNGVYAVGDVNGISMLDSTAFSQANVAINSMLGQERRFDHRWIPRCVHTEPSIAAVGWTEPEAAAQGIEYLAVSDSVCLMSDNERSVIDPEPTFVKVLIDAHSRHLLGCLVLGDHAPVVANIAAIAIRSGLSVEKLREMPLAQPSASEALLSTLRKLN
ncbi:MAG TPA: NAD(P)/FAD-dependent oxidoreductase [Chthoniobacterales bacterium]|nr:NAD(P)/FAD-dependent oxidoreductase [Chthoniobacterales bacterium]